VSTDDTAAGASRALLDVEPGSFREHFNRLPFLVRHRLEHEPLFALERLIELAKALPEDRVEYNAGDVPISLDPRRTPRTGLSVEETIRGIEECRSWMALKNVERDPRYARLLDRCLDEIQERSEPLCPGMRMREGFIFVSSPGSVTPYHIDPEHNFLLQIRGTKTVSLFDGDDRGLLSERELEAFYARGHRNLAFQDTNQAMAHAFELAPGDALYFPVTWPHWVRNGPKVSVSFSITFRTASSDRREILFRINQTLRRLRLQPRPVGRSPRADDTKYLLYRTWSGARRLFGDGRSPAGRQYH
jgi:hypothetical protein